LITVAALAIAGCSGPAGPNPPQLWLSLMGSETRVQLVPYDPGTF
jgi:hypothetical protein